VTFDSWSCFKCEATTVLRVNAAQRKARRIWPGPVGEAVSSQLVSVFDLRSVLGPGSLSERLLVEIEGLSEPVAQVDTTWVR
jgi:hypothetical protein